MSPSLATPVPQEQAPLLEMLDTETAARLRSVLHHPDFQALESTWRSLDFLVREAGDDVRLYAIDVSRQELDRQLASQDDPAAGALGRRLEALRPHVILGAFSFGPDDVAALKRIGRLAAACGTAFIGGAGPALVGCASFSSLPDPRDWTSDATAEAFFELRRSAEAAHIGLALPRFLIRRPYGKGDPLDTFPFEELPASDPHEARLWANSAFLCGRLLLDAFAADGHGMDPAGQGGEIGGLPLHSYTAGDEIRTTPCAEAWLTDRAADAILSRGLIPVLSVRGRDSVLIVSLRSIADPARPLALRTG